MSQEQSRQFVQLVTTDTARQHGTRRAGDNIEPHKHEEVAVYQVLSGQAQLLGSNGPVATLGPQEEHDAVEVQPWEEHGWEILADGTRIDHVTTQQRVEAVLAVA